MSRRILVVDDNEANRYALVRLLRRDGYEVAEAADGAGCLAAIRAGPRPDLVILDVGLPDLSGIEVCRQIKAMPEHGSVLVLNTSAAFTRVDDRARGLDNGADGYLVQPIEPQELTATVRSLLRIREMEERLRVSNRDLELFAHAAAHDLREPMRVIGNFVHLIDKRYGAQLPEGARGMFAQVIDGAERMNRLIDMLLRFAAVERDDEPAAPATDLRAAVDEALGNLAVPVRESGAEITIGALPTVAANPVQMVALFQNLLGNAVKFHQPGKQPHVRVAAEEQADAWAISVADDGIGIPAEHRERLFRHFQRLNTIREFPGTGLGLALCRKIVERHRGTIDFTSQPGAGTIFTVVLPKGSPAAGRAGQD